jgi:hypothetical protein
MPEPPIADKSGLGVSSDRHAVVTRPRYGSDMQTKRRMLTAVAGGGLAAMLTGCSVNTMIW